MGTTGVYNRAKTNLARKLISLEADDIRVLLVSSGYIFSPAHQFVSQVVTGELSGTGYVRKTLANKTLTQDDINNLTKFDADDLVWTGANFANVPAGSGVPDAAILYVESTDDTNRPLICSVNINLKITTSGVNYTVQWGPNGILTLV